MKNTQVYVAFYKGFKGNLLDKFICLWTHGPYSHVELVLHYNNPPQKSLCFSVSPRENNSRFKDIELSEDKWELVPVCINYHLALENSLKFQGFKYDYVAIFLTFLLPFRLQSTKRFFCSELVSIILSKCGYQINQPFHTIHPNKLYKLLMGDKCLKDDGQLKKQTFVTE